MYISAIENVDTQICLNCVHGRRLPVVCMYGFLHIFDNRFSFMKYRVSPISRSRRLPGIDLYITHVSIFFGYLVLYFLFFFRTDHGQNHTIFTFKQYTFVM